MSSQPSTIKGHYDIHNIFIKDGVKPVLPTHSSWIEMSEFIGMHHDSTTEPELKSVHDVLERWFNKYKTADRTYGYGLTARPIIETYIQWCTRTNAELSDFICNTQNTVVEHPAVIKALQQYVISNTIDHYNKSKPVLRLLMSLKNVGTELEQLLESQINKWSVNLDYSKFEDIGELYPYLKSPIYIPLDKATDLTATINHMWPLDDRNVLVLQKHQSWVKHIERFEPVLASWLDTNHHPDVIMTEVYNYLSMVDFTKNDMYTAWLYISLQQFLNKPETQKSKQYEDFNVYTKTALDAIPLATHQSWSQKLSFVDALHDGALEKAMALVPRHNLECKNVFDLPSQLETLCT